MTASPGAAVAGTIATAVANIPGRTSDAGFASSMAKLAATNPDFIQLNEVNRHTTAQIAAAAPGFAAYRDPVVDASKGGRAMSMENVVLWRTSRWRLLDAGRVKIVDDDSGYLHGHPFIWDRYATWTVLQRTDGAVASVVTTHAPTNPAKFPRQYVPSTTTRVQRFAAGMGILVNLVRQLSAYGPVLVGGDMNSHPGEGAWTTAAHLVGAGYGYAKDSGVMYQFYPAGVTVAGSRQLTIVSDHPALVTSLNMNGVTGSGGAGSGSGSGTPGMPRLPSGEQVTSAQLSNAASIVNRGRAAKLPTETWVAAIAASLAETDLQNVAAAPGGGVGIFAQQPSRGWGTAQTLASPDRAADAFFGTAAQSRVKGLRAYPWRTMSLAEIDGAVLGSPFPERYAERAADARFLTQYVTSGGHRCTSRMLAPCPTTDRGITATGRFAGAARTAMRCLHRAFPQVHRYVGTGTGRYCEGTNLVAGLDVPLATQSLGKRIVHYLQVHAADLRVSFVVFAGQTWSADDAAAGWRPYGASDGSRSRQARVLDRVFVAIKGASC